MRRIVLFPLLFATLLAPREARAQRTFAGVGGGASFVRDEGTGEEAWRPSLRAFAGWRVAPGISLLLEGTAHGIAGDEEPRVSDFPPGSSTRIRDPKVLAVLTLFAAVQLDLSDELYVRLALGLGRHAFEAYRFGPGNQAQDAFVGHEAGPAAGYTFGVAHNVFLTMEGAGVWSHGEDSAGSRLPGGLYIVPTVSF
jgi:hypothetical protein